jgi:uncharacterized membrane protein YoaK (UPF0700 family)
MQNLRSPRAKTKAGVALLLTFAAGMVDIVGYLAIYHIFVAHMTGTTVRFGNKLVTADWAEVVKAGAIIFSFVAGSVIGRVVIEAAARTRFRRIASFTLTAEALLIAFCIWMGVLVLDTAHSPARPTATVCALLGLLAAAMGLQTATLTKIGPLTIHTTFVTGMLNKFGESVAQWSFWVHDEWKKNVQLWDVLRGSRQNTAFREAIFMMAIWVCYVSGSVVGTSLNPQWNIRSLYLPIAVLAAAAIVDQFRPLAVEEEKEQQ